MIKDLDEKAKEVKTGYKVRFFYLPRYPKPSLQYLLPEIPETCWNKNLARNKIWTEQVMAPLIGTKIDADP